ncbi:DNA/RNA helicase domain-containing protein [Polaribacter sargassicola]|uniref:DNA/RNA helicase domain-containing protein n=1 Tax=Polaribacter sargassicola TaxID=2836891 RepID=UPI001F1C00DF|nr:DNA/RNA helicase domain-containing protein [Polaribacter sp. DS7-9]MCG1037715.1 NERD domain-containing protein [Polaribacter sp. DS7-9]
MPVTLLNNYPENNLEKSITKKDNSPLYGEIWLYEQFLKFNKNKFLENESWFLKHDYNLSTHPASKKKVEGQIDFVVLSKYGILIIEVKGGGLRVDESDNYFSYDRKGEFKTQNPFNQAKEYTHTLKQLIDEGIFIYRAVVLPHEAGFVLKGPQLRGYNNLFFSKKDFTNFNEIEDEKVINKIFFDFLIDLAKTSRSKIIKELNPSWPNDKINNKRFEKYPELSSRKIKSLRSQLFPSQSSYGYNPERINSEIILKENYETLKGLSRNRKVIIQGAPGTGKTVLAKKFLAEHILKQQKGIYYCANKLIKSKIEHLILRDYGVNDGLIDFKVYSENIKLENLSNEIDFIIFDEAQEYFNKGLFELIEKLEREKEFPKFLVLYDPKQTIIYNFSDISFYTDFYIDNGFTHYLFDETYRCGQNENIIKISNDILNSKEIKDIPNTIKIVDQLKVIKEIIDETKFLKSEQVILVHSSLIDSFKEIAKDYFNKDLEELIEKNINIPSSKIRFTTPIKYRGLENKAVYLITNNLDEKSKVQNYVAVTRAMEHLKIVLWKA